MSSVPKQIIDKFLEHAAGVDGVVATANVESRDVPAEVRNGACVVALWRACPALNKETGGGGDVTWEWSIRIYVALPDFESAQEDFYEVVPSMLALGQSDGLLEDLNGLGDSIYVGSLKLTDPGMEPHFEIDEGWALKELRLSVESYQPPIA
jgi:hypothetical protein